MAVPRAAEVEESDRLALIVEASGRLLGAAGRDEAVAAVLELAGRGLDADAYALWRRDVREDRWSLDATAGLSDAYRRNAEASVDENRSRMDLLEPLVVEDIHAVPWLEDDHKQAHLEEGNRSMIAVPLRPRDEITGTLVFYYRTQRRFSEAEVRTASALAALGASAVEAATLRERNVELVGETRASEALLESVYRTAPVGLAFFDLELRYLRMNDALADTTGISFDEVRGRQLFDVFPSFRAALEPVLLGVLDSGEPALDVELSGETPAARGVRRHWLCSFYPVRAADGETIGIGLVANEVTERRRLEVSQRFLAEASAVLASTLDYEQALRQVAVLSTIELADWCRVDLRGPDGELRRLITAHQDPGKEQICARIDERWPERNFEIQLRGMEDGQGELNEVADERLVEVAQDEEHLTLLRSLRISSSITVPLVARGRALGAITFVAAGAGRSFDEADFAFAQEIGRRASTAIDNAELYRAAEERAQAALVLSHVADGVFLLDGLGIVRFWNPAAETITGVEAGTIVGRALRDALPTWEGLAERIPVAEAPALAASRAQTLPLEAGGGERWLSISGVRFQGGTVFAFRDLTEERALERLKSDFVSTVSHELRTPLAAIYGAALTLRRADVRLDEAQRTGMLDVISSESDRLARIVNDILWASRLDSGAMSIAIESCDPAWIARQVFDAAAAYAPPGIRLSLDAAADLPRVAADPDKARQVLTNLLDNAIKYSPEGGAVRLAIVHEGARVRFEVSDEGLGIPQAEQGRIFEKFYHLDPNLTRGVGGTGLGLYICRELVHRMDGRILVRSGDGRGSTFCVELPAA